MGEIKPPTIHCQLIALRLFCANHWLIPLRPVGVKACELAAPHGVSEFFMFSRLLQRASVPSPRAETLASAEQCLMAETLLLASAHLLDDPDPMAAIEHMCESIVTSTPHIPVVWAWFGDVRAETIRPQIVVGMPSAMSAPLSFVWSDVTCRSSANRVLNKRSTRAFDVSTLSGSAQCRELAQRLDLNSALVVPVSNGGDDRGLLCFYSTRPKYFESISTGLLETLGQWSHFVLTQSKQRPELDADARRDSMTGVHSRRHAQHLMDDAWRAPPQHDNRGVLMLINIDEFAKINASCGTRVGDLTLRHLARVLEQNLRRSDVIARWGGDEFLVWLPAVSGTAALTTAELLRTSIASNLPDVLDGWAMSLRVSVGATPVPSTDSFASALDRADRALVAAKENGGDCVVVARPGA